MNHTSIGNPVAVDVRTIGHILDRLGTRVEQARILAERAAAVGSSLRGAYPISGGSQQGQAAGGSIDAILSLLSTLEEMQSALSEHLTEIESAVR